MGKGQLSKVHIYPAPQNEHLSPDFDVSVNGKPVPVYPCRVSAVPLNQVWPGYQRPVNQTELASFVSIEAGGPVTLTILCPRNFTSVVVRPLSINVSAIVKDQHIQLALPGPGQYTLEIDGWHHALHVFIDPPEGEIISPDDPGVLYFAPGIHHTGRVELKDNQTVYVAGGAVVYGSFYGEGVNNIRLLGRGIVDGSQFERGEGGGAIRLLDCSGITVNGLILRDPDVWCCSLFGCRDAELSNLKLVGLWRYNADGIDLCNSQNIRVRDCFVRAFDDCIVLKGLKQVHSKQGASFGMRPVQNIQVERCVLWNDWGRALEIGAETSSPEFARIVFKDCDIIRTTHIAMDIQHGDRANIHDIVFDNIRLEVDDFNMRPKLQESRDEVYITDQHDDYCPQLMVIIIQQNPYSKDGIPGIVRDITFRDITVHSRLLPQSSFTGFDETHTVQGVTIINLKHNNQVCMDAQQAGLMMNAYVSGVEFVAE
ncbi:MAG: glycosyl hydrolase family 28 protein [Anaerolineae bacterium]|nr:glycosyl hydrolase family 28 protein [Anaerolineae bacterium]